MSLLFKEYENNFISGILLSQWAHQKASKFIGKCSCKTKLVVNIVDKVHTCKWQGDI